MARIKGGTRVHKPTIAWQIDNVKVLDGSLFKGRYKKTIYTARGSHDKTVKHLPSAALTSSQLGVKYFGHWLRDDCSTYLLANDIGTPLATRTPNWPDKDVYARYFGQDWTPTDRAFIENLTIFQDYSQNSLQRRRYETLRGMVRQHVRPCQPGQIVYLRRGGSGAKRTLENENELIEALEKRGVAILTAEGGRLDDMIANLLDAMIVISTEGSQFNHALATMSNQGALVVLQPPYRFNNVHMDWAECLGIKYGFVVGNRSKNGFTIDEKELLHTIDLALAQTSQGQ